MHSHQISNLVTIYDTKLPMNNDNNFIGMISELMCMTYELWYNYSNFKRNVYKICLTNSYSTLN